MIEHITRPPKSRRGERLADYRARFAVWERDQAHIYRRCTRISTSTSCLSAHGSALYQRLMHVCFARGTDYHPIVLSERIVVGFLQLRGTRARQTARGVLDEMLAVGMLRQISDARGSRAGLYVLVAEPIKFVAREGRSGAKPCNLRPLVKTRASRRSKKSLEQKESGGVAPTPTSSSSQGARARRSPTEQKPSPTKTLEAYLEGRTSEQKEKASWLKEFLGGGPRTKTEKVLRPLVPVSIQLSPREHELRVRAQARALLESVG